MSKKLPQKELTRDDFLVGWICPLSTDLAAALAVLDEVMLDLPFPKIRGDSNHYHYGRIHHHYIVIACLPAGAPGTASASWVSANMIRSFPNLARGIGMIVGVGGAAPNLRKGRDIRLGDIVVSKPEGRTNGLIQYDYGTATEGGGFVMESHLVAPSTVLLSAVDFVGVRDPEAFARGIREKAQRIGSREARFKHPQSPDNLFEATHLHVQPKAGPNHLPNSDSGTCAQCDLTKRVKRPERKSDVPHIHKGIIASGNQTMKDAVKRDKISAETGALCFEREAGSIKDDFRCLVVRGISNYADGHSNKSWVAYAALVAALFAKEILLVVPKIEPPKWPAPETREQ
ncbi:hypothetical protein AOL_s00080g76 [Orbilia oligospora ATCC 24927]|uniref:Nucleoside phosphorylase domain-containing protein n=1 Tax=Arthrobotrys oligospora (strain ATCC 24927 / CBS 115.81 / DSM 1491) TaxID=756982 RepID=G1XE41_ARTOA|nr:hypothetical protein AOL_s00080g76 [Orbilia oligospora ATCC 24927]EGX48447.1 hypothetical protein AOL_s00080g76 [Orbilia oligospora ATCC 24927]